MADPDPNMPPALYDDDYKTLEALEGFEVLPRGAGFGALEADRNIPHKLASSTHVYCGVCINLEHPIWVRSSLKGKPVPENNFLTGKSAGLTYWGVKCCQDLSQGGNVKPWAMLDYNFHRAGSVHRIKRMLNRPPQPDSNAGTESDLKKWSGALHRGIPPSLNSRLNIPMNVAPTLSGPVRGEVPKPQHATPYVKLYTFSDYSLTPYVIQTLREVLQRLPKDLISLQEAALSLLIWWDLTTHYQEENMTGLTAEYPIPEVTLVKFIIYFPIFLRRCETWRLTAYPHPFRFIDKVYADDLKKENHQEYVIDDDLIDPVAAIRDLERHPPDKRHPFYPCDLPGTTIPALSDVEHSQFPDERVQLMAPFRECAKTVLAVQPGDFDKAIIHSKFSHVVLVPESSVASYPGKVDSDFTIPVGSDLNIVFAQGYDVRHCYFLYGHPIAGRAMRQVLAQHFTRTINVLPDRAPGLEMDALVPKTSHPPTPPVPNAQASGSSQPSGSSQSSGSSSGSSQPVVSSASNTQASGSSQASVPSTSDPQASRSTQKPTPSTSGTQDSGSSQKQPASSPSQKTTPSTSDSQSSGTTQKSTASTSGAQDHGSGQKQPTNVPLQQPTSTPDPQASGATQKPTASTSGAQVPGNGQATLASETQATGNSQKQLVLGTVTSEVQPSGGSSKQSALTLANTSTPTGSQGSGSGQNHSTSVQLQHPRPSTPKAPIVGTSTAKPLTRAHSPPTPPKQPAAKRLKDITDQIYPTVEPLESTELLGVLAGVFEKRHDQDNAVKSAMIKELEQEVADLRQKLSASDAQLRSKLRTVKQKEQAEEALNEELNKVRKDFEDSSEKVRTLTKDLDKSRSDLDAERRHKRFLDPHCHLDHDDFNSKHDFYGIVKCSLSTLPIPMKELFDNRDLFLFPNHLLPRLDACIIKLLKRVRHICGYMYALAGVKKTPEAKLVIIVDKYDFEGFEPSPFGGNTMSPLSGDSRDELERSLLSLFGEAVYQKLAGCTAGQLVEGAGAEDEASLRECFSKLEAMMTNVLMYTVLVLFIWHCVDASMDKDKRDLEKYRADAMELVLDIFSLMHIARRPGLDSDLGECAVYYLSHEIVQKPTRKAFAPEMERWIGPMALTPMLGLECGELYWPLKGYYDELALQGQ